MILFIEYNNLTIIFDERLYHELRYTGCRMTAHYQYFCEVESFQVPKLTYGAEMVTAEKSLTNFV